MVTAHFMIMTKKDNSTKQPTSPLPAGVTIHLKDGCSLLRPSIEVSWPDGGTPSANYCYIDSPFRRYYWIDNWTYERGMWVADMHCDVLASYKTYIGLANKYVLRSASQSDPNAIDTEYPATADITKLYKTVSIPNWGYYGSAEESGSYVLTCVGDNASSSRTGIVQFQVPSSTVQTVVRNASSAVQSFLNTAADDLVTVAKMLTRAFADIKQFLTSVRWFPCTFSADTAQAERIHLSVYPVTNAQYAPISDPLNRTFFDIDVSDWPAAGADKWEWLAPYATYTLDAEPWGVINIDPNDIVNSDHLRLIIRTDSLSGLSLLELYTYEDNNYPRLLAARTAQIGIDIPYGGSGVNLGNMLGGAVQVAATAAAAYSGNAGVGELAASIGSAAAASTAQGYVSGASGGGAAIKNSMTLYCRRLGHVDTNIPERGKPLCKTVVLNTLSGFIQCKDGEIDAVGATSAELSQIAGYLTGGFFYE